MLPTSPSDTKSRHDDVSFGSADSLHVCLCGMFEIELLEFTHSQTSYETWTLDSCTGHFSASRTRVRGKSKAVMESDMWKCPATYA